MGEVIASRDELHGIGVDVTELPAGAGDGMTAGAITSTGDVLRASIKCIGLQKGIKSVSSHFIMVVPDCPLGESGVMMFADCAVLPDPTKEQLADIAIATAEMMQMLLGFEPRTPFREGLEAFATWLREEGGKA